MSFTLLGTCNSIFFIEYFFVNCTNMIKMLNWCDDKSRFLLPYFSEDPPAERLMTKTETLANFIHVQVT